MLMVVATSGVDSADAEVPSFDFCNSLDLVCMVDGEVKLNGVYKIADDPEVRLRLVDGTLFDLYAERSFAMDRRKALESIVCGLYDGLLGLAVSVEVSPVNAAVDLTASGVSALAFLPESYGRTLNVEKTLALILNNMSADKTIVECEFYLTPPSVTVEGLRSRLVRIGEATTFYGYSESGRKQNIALAARSLNGAVIESGEKFSFNRTVGSRTIQRGYAEANQILNGEYVRGIGGGVCQVSSTLFYAVLRGGLPIAERRSHTLEVSYIGAGLDATVSEGVDFAFVNNTPEEIILFADADGERLRVTLYGCPLYKNVKVYTRVSKIKHFSTIEQSGEEDGVYREGRDGRSMVTTVVCVDAGIERELYSLSSAYAPIDRIVLKKQLSEP